MAPVILSIDLLSSNHLALLHIASGDRKTIKLETNESHRPFQ